MKNSVIVHYHSQAGSYFDYSLWKWIDLHEGEDVPFSSFDHFGLVGQLDFESPYFLEHVYVIVKNQDWSVKTRDFKIERHMGFDVTEVWIVEGDDTLYYSSQAAISSRYYRHRDNHAFDMALNHERFDRIWGFDGWLGSHYDKQATEFRLWAPTAMQVDLIFYESARDDAPIEQILPMKRGISQDVDNHQDNTHGVWMTRILGDHDGQAYAYRLKFRDYLVSEVRDPYSTATSANGKRSVILSPERTKPEGFCVKHGHEATWRLTNPNQAVISEMHIRDFSKSETSGVSPDKRGLFLGACESGTKNTFGDKTGFDYLKQLGISHVQLQPIFDHHQTFDKEGVYAYNWGYDPENFNVPEASFSSRPDKPEERILELKTLIQAYHDAGIGVIMDVVYNHTYASRDSVFQLVVPDYYYRMNPDGSFQNGSGCGNETASEKEMYRKYMIDSILYWVNTYNIDGFRFDLMGLHDVETMNRIRQAVDEIDPNIIIYGEGWDMGMGLLPEQKAKKDNAHLMPNIGFFNDNVRDAIKGSEVYGHFKRGFVSGASTEGVVAKGMLGSDELSPYLSPNQVLNYVEAHDNYNLNDLLLELHPDDDHHQHIRRVELASAMGLLMQGMSFMQLGQEFLRSKLYPTGPHGELTDSDKRLAMNSYNAPDEVNQIDWNNVTKHHSTMAFIRALIKLKRHDAAFSYQSFEEIREHLYIKKADEVDHIIICDMIGEKHYRIIFNFSEEIMENEMTDMADYAILITNIKRLHKRPKTLDALSASVFEIKK
ncbi:type I pullulanase [Streptococcus sp. zg-JUN1979]|uniref:type I pullulanase n=1 Tax=Streptococcus sp. zg-JUN1979 TaxID=3391450 RepID=UPI0039A593DA